MSEGYTHKDQISQLYGVIEKRDTTIDELNARLNRWQQGHNRIGTNHLLNKKDAEIAEMRGLLDRSLRLIVAGETKQAIRDYLNKQDNNPNT